MGFGGVEEVFDSVWGRRGGNYGICSVEGIIEGICSIWLGKGCAYRFGSRE